LRNAAGNGWAFSHDHRCFVAFQGNQKLHALFSTLVVV
jgi:hypothetical protein